MKNTCLRPGHCGSGEVFQVVHAGPNLQGSLVSCFRPKHGLDCTRQEVSRPDEHHGPCPVEFLLSHTVAAVLLGKLEPYRRRPHKPMKALGGSPRAWPAPSLHEIIRFFAEPSLPPHLHSNGARLCVRGFMEGKSRQQRPAFLLGWVSASRNTFVGGTSCFQNSPCCFFRRTVSWPTVFFLFLQE